MISLCRSQTKNKYLTKLCGVCLFYVKVGYYKYPCGKYEKYLIRVDINQLSYPFGKNTFQSTFISFIIEIMDKQNWQKEILWGNVSLNGRYAMEWGKDADSL
jgi:hypothetical protein